MKKDIKWLKNKVLISKETYMTARDNSEPHSGSRRYYNGMLNSVSLTLDFINELDEPEVLSEEWINKNKEDSGVHYIGYYVPIGRLFDLIITKQELPEQELPVIPQFVADYLEKAKKEIDLLRVFEIANGLDELDMWRKEYNWIRLYHLDFAKAWLYGYEVEKEQKYYVRENNYLLCKWENEVIDYVEAVSHEITDLVELKLTEQEIKNYDSRYWVFRKPVDEVVSE